MKNSDKRLGEIERRLGAIAGALERSRFIEYAEYSSDLKRMLKRAFLYGAARGLGMAVGFSLLGALVIWLLDIIARSNIPYIAEFISKIVSYVESNCR
ncbi:MAG: hypothetical protein J5854_05110 [Clostridia bacterium]|nr:hypothetical protein [Clostridia bacterium]